LSSFRPGSIYLEAFTGEETNDKIANEMYQEAAISKRLKQGTSINSKTVPI
jgi:hypothetical protein